MTSRTQSGWIAHALDVVQRAWSFGEVEALDDLLSADYVRHGQTRQMSRSELKEAITDMRRAFPDLTMEVIRCVVGEDEIAIHWQSTGTLMDTFLGLPPTGRTFMVRGTTFSRVENDRIAEEWVVWDHRGSYHSLGMNLLPKHRESYIDDGHVDPESLRSFHRRLVTGVTVVATMSEDEPRGLAVNAFSSVSLEPPLILICIQKNSSTYAPLLGTQYFGVSVLAADQVDAANVFATKQPHKFDLVDWHQGQLGTPLISGASASMEVELQDTLHASTHTIFIGQVRRVYSTDAPPLIYTGGRFFDGGQLVPVRAAEPLQSTA